MEAILRRFRLGWVFFDQENSSTARNTSYPMSRMVQASALWDRVKGSKVPGKKATLCRWRKGKGPLSVSYRTMNWYMRYSAAEQYRSFSPPP